MKKIIFPLSTILIIVMLIMTFLASFISYKEVGPDRDYVDFSSQWSDEYGYPVSLDTISRSCKIHKKIPKLEKDSLLSFNARNVDVDVYIDDLCVYKAARTNNNILDAFYGKSKGSDFVEVRLLSDYSGKTISLDIHNPYSNANACKIVNMFMGDGVQIIKHDASTQLGPFCFSIIILFLGVVCILLYPPMLKSNIADRSMLYLGIAAFTFGMSMITDCKLLHVIVGHETLFYTVSQWFMALLGVPLLLFFARTFGKSNEKIILILSAVNILDFITIFVLNCFGIIDYHDNSFFLLVVLGGTILYITVITIKNFIANPLENLFHNIGVLMISVSVVLDMFMVNSDVFVETSFFTRFGIAGFTFMECAQVIWKHIAEYQNGVKAQLISRLAYHDGLTDMLNRTSFIEDMDKLENEDKSDILIAVFDVNNLKFVNDNYGHTDGDELIINAANSIRKAFDSFGKCYRTGGDEFVFITRTIGAEANFIEAQEKMLTELERISENYQYPVSVASGYAIMSEKHASLKDLLDEADEKMYANKKLMKESSAELTVDAKTEE